MPQTKPYNRISAVNYANQWALGRNPAYADFSNMGGTVPISLRSVFMQEAGL